MSERAAAGRWLCGLVLLVALIGLPAADVAVPGFGPRASSVDRPPMGWNSWNAFGCDIDENRILGAARALVTSGMRDAGYRYVIVDDCWQASTRAADGSLVADPVRFPHGMAALGAQIHALGLRFGIYQSPGEQTCAELAGNIPGATGARGHETQDARTFAAWGVDYLKYDWCSPDGTVADQARTFATMDRALRATGRPIVYSINPNSDHDLTGPSYAWGAVADLWRTTWDITATWRTGCPAACVPGAALGIADIVDAQAPLWAAAGPGHWNDPDMLEVGVQGALTPTENRAHFGMWAMLAAPLIAGNDVAAMPADVRAVLTDPDVVAIDQDPSGRQARRVSADAVQVWARPLADGSVAVALLNPGDTAATATASLSAVSAAGIPVPAASRYDAFELWSKTTAEVAGTITATVPAHGLALYRVRPAR